MLKKENSFRAMAVVLDGNKILLCRKERMGTSYWALPGGQIENGESMTTAVAREVKEETGYDIAIEKWLYVRHCNDVLRGRTFEVYILGRVIGGKPSAEMVDDIKEIRLVSIGEISGLELRPAVLKDVLLSDIASGFAKNPRDLGFEEY
ncbi:NUDIX hydrolase [Candidatus Woesearchaeota archaeon]|nr:NUDIX hydrolase [Candidatus Woesearchaeota archaeon]